MQVPNDLLNLRNLDAVKVDPRGDGIDEHVTSSLGGERIDVAEWRSNDLSFLLRSGLSHPRRSIRNGTYLVLQSRNGTVGKTQHDALVSATCSAH